MDDNYRLSEFNELQFKMIRVHKLQDTVNELWINPLLINMVMGDHNYKLILSSLIQLYGECHAKCKKDEKIKFQNLIDEIELMIDDNPPFVKHKIIGSRDKLDLDNENWKKIKTKLKEIDLYIKELLDNHGFSPDRNLELLGL